MAYRAAVDANNIVICIDQDYGQTGSYNGSQGTWCGFTFTTIPTLATGVEALIASHAFIGNGLMASGSSIVARSYSDVAADY